MYCAAGEPVGSAPAAPASAPARSADKKTVLQTDIPNLNLSDLLDVVDGRGEVSIGKTKFNQSEIDGYLKDAGIKTAIGQQALALIKKKPLTKQNEVVQLLPY